MIAEPDTLTVRWVPDAGGVPEDWPREGRASVRAMPTTSPRIPHRNRVLTEPPFWKRGSTELFGGLRSLLELLGRARGSGGSFEDAGARGAAGGSRRRPAWSPRRGPRRWQRRRRPQASSRSP